MLGICRSCLANGVVRVEQPLSPCDTTFAGRCSSTPDLPTRALRRTYAHVAAPAVAAAAAAALTVSTVAGAATVCATAVVTTTAGGVSHLIPR